jgi:hypothetical protein
MFDALITFLNWLGTWLVQALPQSPFQSFASPVLSEMQQGLHILNWFFPVADILQILTVWLISVGVYYLYKAALHYAGLGD